MVAEVPDTEVVFEAHTPLTFGVRVSRSYWQWIVSVKHPAMAGRELDVREALETPDEVRRSRRDPSVHLFYKAERRHRWVCAVAKRLNHQGFLITTYPTEAIKEGVRIWPK